MREVRSGTHRLYKGSYIITFYDDCDEYLKYMFDNVRDILKFQGKEINSKNVNLINIEIYRALKTKTHITRFLTGEIITLHLIKINNKKGENKNGNQKLC